MLVYNYSNCVLLSYALDAENDENVKVSNFTHLEIHAKGNTVNNAETVQSVITQKPSELYPLCVCVCVCVCVRTCGWIERWEITSYHPYWNGYIPANVNAHKLS